MYLRLTIHVAKNIAKHILIFPNIPHHIMDMHKLKVLIFYEIEYLLD